MHLLISRYAGQTAYQHRQKRKQTFTQQLTAGYQKISNNQLEQLMKKKEPSSLSISLPSVPSVFFVAASFFVKSFHYTALPAH